MKRYRTIVADPPWVPLDKRNRTGISFEGESGAVFKATTLAYPTMTVEEIAALPVDDIAARDAHVFVWTTQHHLEFTFSIVRRWGFVPTCTLAWCKAPRGWGPGGTFQSTLEFVVYARRGRADVEGQINRQWWTWPRGAHSAKPDAFLDLVESAFPSPRLELFARRARFGWDYAGDGSLGTVQIPGLRNPNEAAA